jgi:hypothetical protein
MTVFLIGNRMKGKKIPDRMIPVLYGLVAVALAGLFGFTDRKYFTKSIKINFRHKSRTLSGLSSLW